MRTAIPLSLAFLALLFAGTAGARGVQQQLADDPVAQACKVLADAGNETAAEHYAAIRRQLQATARTREEGAPEGESVRDFQQLMRAAAEARAWCGAVPIQTSPEAPAHTDDAEIPKEWVRQTMLRSYAAKGCEQVLENQQSGEPLQQCRKMKAQLDAWATYYAE